MKATASKVAANPRAPLPISAGLRGLRDHSEVSYVEGANGCPVYGGAVDTEGHGDARTGSPNALPWGSGAVSFCSRVGSSERWSRTWSSCGANS